MASSTSIPIPVRSALIGVLSGARSMTPIAMLGLSRQRASLQGPWQQWPVLSSSTGRVVLLIAAVGELVGDKLPAAPSRTSPVPLLGRIGTGAVTGAALGTLAGEGGWRQGAVLGAFGGLVGSYAGSYLRAGGAATGLPDLVFALIEDVATVACTAAVLAAD